MKIPSQLHQFARERALILVSGKQDALFYEAADGRIFLVDSIHIPRPHYSDNEGFFAVRSGDAGAIRSGSVREIKDQDIISDFIKELRSHLGNLHPEQYSEVYVMAPAKTKNEIKENLRPEFKSKVRGVIDGNYRKSDPLEIIRKIESL